MFRGPTPRETLPVGGSGRNALLAWPRHKKLMLIRDTAESPDGCCRPRREQYLNMLMLPVVDEVQKTCILVQIHLLNITPLKVFNLTFFFFFRYVEVLCHDFKLRSSIPTVKGLSHSNLFPNTSLDECISKLPLIRLLLYRLIGWVCNDLDPPKQFCNSHRYWISLIFVSGNLTN